ncbi:MAG TPA: glycosyltransferase [Candidatus Acidoferrales bacterium]|nr:glycosyltransferase [Candidatus Acidoferrales bacterium]
MRVHSNSWPINALASRMPEWWAGWPDGKKFAFALTHDVEGEVGLGRCRQLAEMEMSLDFRSSFNFVPEGEYQTPKSLRDFLTGYGFEIGVHDLRHDGRLYYSRKTFKDSSSRINRYLAEWGAVGFRSGFMRHNLDWVHDLDVLYDASTFDTDPFEPQPDGVNTIFPFWVGRENGSGYVELPYTLAQDSTLFILLRETTIETWTRKLDWVAQYGGLALVNVHPDYMNLNGKRRTSEYEARLYQELLEYVSDRYGRAAWFALPQDIAAYVRGMIQHLPKENVRLQSAVQPMRGCGPGAAEKPGSARPGQYQVVDRRRAADLVPRLDGKRVGMVMLSHYPKDPRPRRAAEALVGAGARVDLICLTLDKQDARHEIVKGINVFRIPIRHSRGSGISYMFEYSAFLLAAAVVLGWRSVVSGYDLVYVHNMPDILVLSALLPKAFGAKIILDLHDPMPELMMTIFGVEQNAFGVRLLRRLEKLSIGLADSAITVNRACAKLFTSRSCPSEKMSVVMNSPDERIFQIRPPSAHATMSRASQKPFVVMYHGSLVERNGLELAVDAFERVRELVPGAQLRIYGWKTPFLEGVMRSVADRGLQQAVQYLGPKSLEQLVEAIDECDVGIIPNRRSVFTELNTPTRIFEYLALGKPAIAPRAGGVCDYFDDSSLILFELGDVEDLARKILYASSHPAEMTEIAKRGQKILGEHTWSQERRRLIKVVAKLLDKKIQSPDSGEPRGAVSDPVLLSQPLNSLTALRAFETSWMPPETGAQANYEE